MRHGEEGRRQGDQEPLLPTAPGRRGGDGGCNTSKRHRGGDVGMWHGEEGRRRGRRGDAAHGQPLLPTATGRRGGDGADAAPRRRGGDATDRMCRELI
jgi:hypothetical protein